MDVEQTAQVIALSELFYGLRESLPRRLAEVPEDAQVVLERARSQFDERLKAISKGIEEAFK